MKGNVLTWIAVAGLCHPFAAAANERRTTRSTRATSLLNGSWNFESGKLKPWAGLSEGSQGTDRARVKIVSPGYNSKYAASLGPAPSGGSGTMEATVNGAPNTNYTITAMYKVVEAASPDCKFSIGGSDNYEPKNDISTTIPMVVGDWTAISVVWPNFVDQYGTFGIDFSVNCPGKANSSVLIDNIVLKATGTLQPASCPGTSTVQNGDFENGQVAPWQISNGASSKFSVVAPGYNSGHALQASFGANEESGAAWWNDVHDVCFNYYYTYSFAINWVNYSPIPQHPPSDGTCSIAPSAYNCAGDDDLPLIWPTANGWKEYSFNCTATRDTVEFYFQLDCGPGSPKQPWAVQLDDVQLKYVGGPAPPPKNPFPDPSPTPTPSPASSHKRAEAVARPRWV